MALKTGTYTGDGNPTQAITGVGFEPKVVMIYSQNAGVGPKGLAMRATDDVALKSALLRLDGASSGYSYADDLIQSFQADGFTVGTYYMNELANVYTYIALG